VSSIVYHGDKVARGEIRRKFLPKTVGPDFPIVVTSYEMAMSDARFLAHYKWKYVVVDEVMGKTHSPNYRFCFAFALSCIHISVSLFSRDTG
jgi:hypothetical protein